ncbi:PilW family protein [Acinetobacter radioresistens]|uniref:PilW family protein n=1 Tax=Acinetobacter radioresistens TaxID=40216 RepID=UPI0032139B7F
MLKYRAGFTLIELMIALALGLVITAAAIMLFITGQRSYSMQQGVADLQDNANFGLNYIVRDIRLANLNSTRADINDQISFGGIVLTSAINAQKDASVPPLPLSNLSSTITGNTAAVSLLSRSSGTGMSAGTAPAWTGISNVNEAGTALLSDQLVIQYRPVEIGGFDCEGQEITSTDIYIVQRYFLRADTNVSANEPNQALALACDAGFYPVTGSPTAITNYGDAGEIIMKRVDYFRVLLGIQNGDNYRYISIADYMAMASPRPRILSLQLGILTRSSQSTGTNSNAGNNTAFTVLDKNVVVKSSTTTNNYIRQVVSQTVALRNGFGERGL